MEVLLGVDHVFVGETALFSSGGALLLGPDYLAVEKSAEFLGVDLGVEAGFLLLDLVALDVGEQLWQLNALFAELLDLPLQEGAVEGQLDEVGRGWRLIYRQLAEAAVADQLLERRFLGAS